MNTKILTLTLCPAVDVHCRGEKLQPGHENLAEILSRDAGGKGINISRALRSAGMASRALVVLGEENASEFRKKLEEYGLDCLYLPQRGRIRENITLHEEGGRETRLSFKGFQADAELLPRLEKLLLAQAPDILTLSGRLPEGLRAADLLPVLRKLKENGCRIVLDSRSFSLKELLALGPWLIKPNQEEISAYLEREIGSFDQLRASARELNRLGVEQVLVSLGSQGALLSTAEGILTSAAPKLSPLSTVGAGDSSIAGFIAAYLQGKDPAECLKTAVAFGSAACLTRGTNPPDPAEVLRLKGLICPGD